MTTFDELKARHARAVAEFEAAEALALNVPVGPDAGGGSVMIRIVDSAIAESVSHNSIVTIEGDADVRAELSVLADGEVESTVDRGPDEPWGYITEYWGGDRDNQWRVHVVHTDD
jgi:hypothetical protein